MTNVWLLALLANAALASSQAAAGTYYVDFDAGSDSASGTSATTAWKHAPGDAAATGAPHAVQLAPGDTVQFKGGVSYHGSITIPASGSDGKPIVYEGSGWGSGQAIISGLDAYALTFADAGGGLAAATLPFAIAAGALVYIDGTKQYPAAYPALGSNGTKPHHIDDATVSFPVRAMGATAPTIADGALAKVLRGLDPTTLPDLYIRVYESGNWNHQGKIASFNASTGVVTLDDPTYRRPDPATIPTGYWHLFNSRAFIASFGQYAFEDGGKTLVARIAPGVHTVELSARSSGILALGKSYLTIDGFEVRGLAGGAKDYWTTGIKTDQGSYLTVTNNYLHDIDNEAGTYAGIQVANGPSHAVVSGNIVGPVIGHGMNVHAATDSTIEDNHVFSSTNSAMALNNLQHSLVRRNRVDDITQAPGAHADAMEIYDIASDPAQGWLDTEFSNNQVSSGAVMVAGSTIRSTATLSPALRFFNNVFGGGLYFTGRAIDGVTVSGNIILTGTAYQYTPANGDTINVTVSNNIIDGALFAGSGGGTMRAPATWTVTNNTFIENASPTTGYFGLAPAENVYNNALRSVVSAALAAPGVLPASVCAVLRPDGTAAKIGIDYACKARR